MFFAKITNAYNVKNRLQDYIGKQLKLLDGIMVADPGEFKKHVETIMHRANLKFPRCRPLVSYLHTVYTTGDFNAGVREVIRFSLYAGPGVFESLPKQVPETLHEGVQTTLFS